MSAHHPGTDPTGTDASTTAESTTDASTAGTHSYTLTREFDAPVAKVWQVWTEPDHFAQWFHAPRASVEMDVRTGGSWKASMQAPDGNAYPMGGTFPEVERHRRIVMTMLAAGMQEPGLMTFAFTDLGARTRVVVRQSVHSADACAQAEEGSGMLLDSFAAHLATV
ncbi:SRPBCC domain-containing protein [Streptomyces sp. 549]|uniref:SRPBCC family protein n=1 Tax=Streptomyces sp. 549 TaxID=3049076 RepID=UPI0024C3A95A|nr:SRPBCC domain-containing protein [Streptomyces sp. 549]MDK1473230.1 SRPBCC domain-containing protein [Streptomyces sp. 549]